MIKTERLILRKTQLLDVDDLLPIVNSDFVQKYNVMPIYSRDMYLVTLENLSKSKSFCIVEKNSNKVIGIINIDPDRMRYDVNSVLISYWLGEEYSNKGYMSEALHSVISYIFNEYGYDIIVARVFADNLVSHKLIKKLGFVQEGYLKTAVRDTQGKVHDDVLYRLFKEEWKNMSQWHVFLKGMDGW